MEKLLALGAAIEMAKLSLKSVVGPAMSDYTVTVNPDKTITVMASPLAQQFDNLIWETVRTWYQALVSADGDAADWPSPPVAAGQASLSGSLGSLGAALAPMLTAIGGPAGLATAAPAILKAVEGVVSTAVSASPTPVAGSAPLAPPAASK